MISKNALLEALSGRFNDGDLLEVRSNVFRAVFEYEKRSYSVHYFDLTPSFLGETFDIDEYQTALVADDYYKHPGSMQWNFYLDFVVADEDTLDPRLIAKKSAIEQNQVYARKSVASLAQLKQFFSPLPQLRAELPKDYRDIWSERLEAVGLDDLMDTALAFDNVVERYLSEGSVQKTKGRTPKRESIARYPKINGIKLQEYRPYPQKRDFQFADFNLIEGVNASGKTSLLEAIELIVCGRSARNRGNAEAFAIKATLGGQESVISPLEDKQYRDRDASWYGRSYVRGNDLFQSFARFNFFDCDAAARFADEVDKGHVGSALEGIVFGVEAKDFASRANAIHQRFIASERALQSQKRDLESELSTETIALDTLRHTDVASITLSLVQSKAISVGFSQEAVSQPLPTIARAVFDVSQALSAAMRPDSVGSNFTSRDIEDRLQVLVRLRDDLATNQNKRTELEHRRFMLVEETKRGTERRAARSRLAEYISKGALVLIDDDGIENRRRRIDLLKDLAGPYAHLTPQHVGVDLTVQALLSDRRQTLRELEEHLHTRRAELDRALLNVQRGRILVKEIRYRASELLKENPNLMNCPVCGTAHVEPTLAARIEVTSTELSGIDLGSAELMDAVRKAEEDVAGVRSDTDSLEALQQIATRLGHDVDSLSADAAYPVIRETLESVESLQIELNSEQLRRNHLEAEGYSAKEAQTLLEGLGLSRADVSQFTLAAPETGIEASTPADTEEAMRQTVGAIEALDRDRASLLKEAPIDSTLPSVIGNLDLRIGNIKRSLVTLSSLRATLVFGDDTDLFELRSRVDEICSSLESLLGAEKEAVEVQRSEARIHDLAKRLSSLDLQIARSTVAIDTIGSLQAEAGIAKRLEFFLRANGGAVRDAFLRIHSPREFVNVVIAANEIVLTRADGTAATARELSTGQRVALALAVFLTMNSLLRQGPELLLFDDPVAYIDDLNMLSFLDLLREIAMLQRRQIFFATANSKVAQLVKVKFDFLSNRFTSHKLERLDTSLLTNETVH